MEGKVLFYVFFFFFIFFNFFLFIFIYGLGIKLTKYYEFRQWILICIASIKQERAYNIWVIIYNLYPDLQETKAGVKDIQQHFQLGLNQFIQDQEMKQRGIYMM